MDDVKLPAEFEHHDADLLQALEPAIRALARKHLRSCADAGLVVKVVSSRRSWEEQDALYAQGREAPGQIVTKARAGWSWHNYGRAYDLAFIVDGRVSWDGPWEKVGKIGEALGLEWGGRWKFQDYGHFQLTGGQTLHQARWAYLRAQAAREK